VAAAIRTPTNVVWVGNSTVNDWIPSTVPNWLNPGTALLDYFVTGDNVLFNNTGAANPIVNLVANNAPTTLRSAQTANYTLGGQRRDFWLWQSDQDQHGHADHHEPQQLFRVTLLGEG